MDTNSADSIKVGRHRLWQQPRFASRLAQVVRLSTCITSGACKQKLFGRKQLVTQGAREGGVSEARSLDTSLELFKVYILACVCPQAAVDKVSAEVGHVDVLINNAGINDPVLARWEDT
jgi:NAD(P)-dependent dehydrogenase (short-subunit alcohol dehydrogenase family)